MNKAQENFSITYGALKAMHAGFIGANRLEYPGEICTVIIEAAPGTSLQDAIDASRRLLNSVANGIEKTDSLFLTGKENTNELESR